MLLKKLISSFLVACLFFTNSSFTYASQTNFWKDRQQSIQLASAWPNGSSIAGLPAPRPLIDRALPTLEATGSSLNNIVPFLSYESGTVRFVRHPLSGPSEKRVVLINDVHMNAEAQLRISSVVESLNKGGGLDFVALEGTGLTLDVSPYRATERTALVAASNYLIESGKISGPVHSALLSDSPPLLRGIEDSALYEANRAAYLNASPLSAPYLRRLHDVERQLRRSIEKNVNSDLVAFDALTRRYQKGTLSLGEYLRGIAVFADLPPALSRFVSAAEMESSIDFARVQVQRASLLQSLNEKLTPNESAALLSKGVAYRVSAISAGEFYAYVSDLMERKGVSLRTYPEFHRYVRYVLAARDIDGTAVFNETARLQKDCYRRLARSDQERLWVHQRMFNEAQQKLVTFSLSADEWDDYVRLKSENKSAGSLEKIGAFETFYTTARQRDAAMSERFLTAARDHKRVTAVLVAGGFHAQGLSDPLTNAGFTVVSFVPKITAVASESGNDYLSVFAQENTPLEKLVRGEKLFLARDPGFGLPLIPVASEAVARWQKNPRRDVSLVKNSAAGSVRVKIGFKSNAVNMAPVIVSMDSGKPYWNSWSLLKQVQSWFAKRPVKRSARTFVPGRSVEGLNLEPRVAMTGPNVQDINVPAEPLIPPLRVEPEQLTRPSVISVLEQSAVDTVLDGFDNDPLADFLSVFSEPLASSMEVTGELTMLGDKTIAYFYTDPFTNQSTRVEFGFDATGRLVSERTLSDGPTFATPIEETKIYSYSADGRRIGFSSAGKTGVYDYAVGETHPFQLTVTNAAGDVVQKSLYFYDVPGQLRELIYRPRVVHESLTSVDDQIAAGLEPMGTRLYAKGNPQVPVLIISRMFDGGTLPISQKTLFIGYATTDIATPKTSDGDGNGKSFKLRNLPNPDLIEMPTFKSSSRAKIPRGNARSRNTPRRANQSATIVVAAPTALSPMLPTKPWAETPKEPTEEKPANDLVAWIKYGWAQLKELQKLIATAPRPDELTPEIVVVPVVEEVVVTQDRAENSATPAPVSPTSEKIESETDEASWSHYGVGALMGVVVGVFIGGKPTRKKKIHAKKNDAPLPTSPEAMSSGPDAKIASEASDVTIVPASAPTPRRSLKRWWVRHLSVALLVVFGSGTFFSSKLSSSSQIDAAVTIRPAVLSQPAIASPQLVRLRLEKKERHEKVERELIAQAKLTHAQKIEVAEKAVKTVKAEQADIAARQIKAADIVAKQNTLNAAQSELEAVDEKISSAQNELDKIQQQRVALPASRAELPAARKKMQEDLRTRVDPHQRFQVGAFLKDPVSGQYYYSLSVEQVAPYPQATQYNVNGYLFDIVRVDEMDRQLTKVAADKNPVAMLESNGSFPYFLENQHVENIVLREGRLLYRSQTPGENPQPMEYDVRFVDEDNAVWVRDALTKRAQAANAITGKMSELRSQRANISTAVETARLALSDAVGSGGVESPQDLAFQQAQLLFVDNVTQAQVNALKALSENDIVQPAIEKAAQMLLEVPTVDAQVVKTVSYRTTSVPVSAARAVAPVAVAVAQQPIPWGTYLVRAVLSAGILFFTWRTISSIRSKKTSVLRVAPIAPAVPSVAPASLPETSTAVAVPSELPSPARALFSAVEPENPAREGVESVTINGGVIVEPIDGKTESPVRLQRTIYQLRGGSREVHTRYRYHKQGELQGLLRHFTLTTSDIADGSVAKKSFKYEYDDKQRVVRLVERKKTTLFGQLSPSKLRGYVYSLVIANKSRPGQPQRIKAIVHLKQPRNGTISFLIFHERMQDGKLISPSLAMARALPPVRKTIPVYVQNGDASLLRRIFSAADEDIVASEQGTEVSYFGDFDTSDHPAWAVTTDEEAIGDTVQRVIKSLVLFQWNPDGSMTETFYVLRNGVAPRVWDDAFTHEPVAAIIEQLLPPGRTPNAKRTYAAPLDPVNFHAHFLEKTQEWSFHDDGRVRNERVAAYELESRTALEERTLLNTEEPNVEEDVPTTTPGLVDTHVHKPMPASRQGYAVLALSFGVFVLLTQLVFRGPAPQWVPHFFTDGKLGFVPENILLLGAFAAAVMVWGGYRLFRHFGPRFFGVVVLLTGIAARSDGSSMPSERQFVAKQIVAAMVMDPVAKPFSVAPPTDSYDWHANRRARFENYLAGTRFAETQNVARATASVRNYGLVRTIKNGRHIYHVLKADELNGSAGQRLLRTADVILGDKAFDLLFPNDIEKRDVERAVTLLRETVAGVREGRLNSNSFNRLLGAPLSLGLNPLDSSAAHRDFASRTVVLQALHQFGVLKEGRGATSEQIQLGLLTLFTSSRTLRPAGPAAKGRILPVSAVDITLVKKLRSRFPNDRLVLMVDGARQSDLDLFRAVAAENPLNVRVVVTDARQNRLFRDGATARALNLNALVSGLGMLDGPEQNYQLDLPCGVFEGDPAVLNSSVLASFADRISILDSMLSVMSLSLDDIELLVSADRLIQTQA